MIEKKKIEKTQKIIDLKYHPGVFFSLTIGGGNCGPKWP